MKHSLNRFIGATSGLMLLLAGPVLAEQAVDETREARPDARISLTAVTGEYQVVGSDAGRLEITGTLGDDVEELIIEGGPDAWTIEVKPEQTRGRSGGSRSSSRLVIGVPAGAELEVRTVSGSAELLDLNGPSVRVNSVSGRVDLAGVHPERLMAESVSGALSLDAAGRVESRLKTVSGNVRAEGLSGRVQVNTVSGNMELAGTAVEDVDLETVSGQILARLEPQSQARLRLSSHSGELRLGLPADVALDLRARTFSGRIRNEFGGDVQNNLGPGPGERMEIRSGDGGVRVEAETFSGGIEVTALD